MTDWIQLVTFHKTAASASVFRGHKREDPCMCADYYQIPTMICRGDNVIVDLWEMSILKQWVVTPLLKISQNILSHYISSCHRPIWKSWFMRSFLKSLNCSRCELMCVSKIWPFHLDKKCGTIHYLLRWPLQNDPKCVTQYHQKCSRGEGDQNRDPLTLTYLWSIVPKMCL